MNERNCSEEEVAFEMASLLSVIARLVDNARTAKVLAVRLCDSMPISTSDMERISKAIQMIEEIQREDGSTMWKIALAAVDGIRDFQDK